MIALENLSKVFNLGGKRKVIADQINAVFPDKTSVALLGRNGAGKSSLLKIIAGTMEPTSGRVIRTGEVSWPVGFAGSFHRELTGAQNVRFLARVYGVDTGELVEFVEEFAELGIHFNLPFGTYSSGMRARLAFGVSMGIKFDTYLVDEVTSVGDAAFRQKSKELFLERMQDAGAVVVTHSMAIVREICDIGVVLEDGQVTVFDDLEEAIAVHQANMKPKN